MHETSGLLLQLFIVYLAALIGAEVAQRLRVPAVVGEIAAGVIVGVGGFGWVRMTEPLEALSELGAVLLLFSVGLETRLGDLRRVGRVASLVGVMGVVLPFVLGALWAQAQGFPTPKVMFIAAAFVATSAGITARVLHEMGVLDRKESRVILGAAVIDDILAMLLLGVVTAIQGGGKADVRALAVVAVQAVAFVALISWVGTRVMRRSSRALDAPLSPHSPLSITLAICLGLAAAAAHLGLAAIIGAFLAGMIAAETEHRKALERQVQTLMVFLVPFFFVATGAQVHTAELANWNALWTLLVVTALAIVGKLAGCGLGALSMGRKSALIVGVGMVPRGEVGIIVASLGASAGVFPDRTYAIIIGMALLTSVLAPPFLKPLLKTEGGGPKAEGKMPAGEAGLIAADEAGWD